MAAAPEPELTEIPEYVHKKPVPMMPLGNTFLLVWALENFQERQLAQLEGHDQQLLSYLGEAVSKRKRTPATDSSVIRVQLQRPLQMLRPWRQSNTNPSDK